MQTFFLSSWMSDSELLAVSMGRVCLGVVANSGSRLGAFNWLFTFVMTTFPFWLLLLVLTLLGDWTVRLTVVIVGRGIISCFGSYVNLYVSVPPMWTNSWLSCTYSFTDFLSTNLMSFIASGGSQFFIIFHAAIYFTKTKNKLAIVRMCQISTWAILPLKMKGIW